ncbi:hypothetical protein BG011_006402 [Mortierella polycephala]|uniref:Pentacotripeptide-repeat region of PRORP domain-containing protein n=1 Tax=Mortierella polycephala TaxID=41804 RepID=A0A9P6PW68_9FUNG|nr:hypothetical protein BG011_006402 [Mortierella polycephala]
MGVRHSILDTALSQRTHHNSTLKSPTVQDLEQLLAKNDYEGFQKACLLLQQQSSSRGGHAISSSAIGAVAGPEVSKEVYHLLLKTLAENPRSFSTLSSVSSTTEAAAATLPTTAAAENVTFEPLDSALGILTEMNRAANVLGKTALQPDRETLLLVLKVAGMNGWESAGLLVDAMRHGSLPVVMSVDQWELPDLNVDLDQTLWKAMFECVHKAASAPSHKKELDTLTYMMADQLFRSSENVEMDEQLWSYVIQAMGNARSSSKLDAILTKLPGIAQTNISADLYSTVAEALANCGSIGQAMEIMHTLSSTQETLSSVKPMIALARQHAKIGHYEPIRHDYKIWIEKGQRSDVNDALHADLGRFFVSAAGVALDRIISMASRTFRDRQADIIPAHVLPGRVTPTHISRSHYAEVIYLWIRSQEAMDQIPKDKWTVEDYDATIRVATRLNLLHHMQWPLEQHAFRLLEEMKQNGLKPLKETYLTLMETIARSREYIASRENGLAVERVMDVFKEMSGPQGYVPTSAQDFKPLIEACFGLSSHSPFGAGQWMYSNQRYPLSEDALEYVEEMMRKTLVATEGQNQDPSLPSTAKPNVQQYHDSITIASVIAGLARGDKKAELLRRWDELALHGVERDATLYQTMIGASQGQDKLARYVLRTLRYEMLKEQPPVRMTPEIFAGLLNCCVRTQDVVSAKSLIAQYSASREIQKSAEWYVPMVRTCFMIEGMEVEGEFLLEEMSRHDMPMIGHQASISAGDSSSSTFGDVGFMEFLMEYLVMRRGDYAAGREIFKAFIKSEQDQVEELLAARENRKNIISKAGFDDHSQHLVMVSDKELDRRARQLKNPIEHLVERVELSPRTASMLNLLLLSHIREHGQALENERASGFGAGSKERMRDAQVVIYHLTGETKKRRKMAANSTDASSTIPDTRSSSIPLTEVSSPQSPPSSRSRSPLYNSTISAASPSEFIKMKTSKVNKGRLTFVNKYVLGEYIDICIKDGSPEMLMEADWALNTIMPRVVQAKLPKDMQRLRQALESAHARSNGIRSNSHGSTSEQESAFRA